MCNRKKRHIHSERERKRKKESERDRGRGWREKWWNRKALSVDSTISKCFHFTNRIKEFQVSTLPTLWLLNWMNAIVVRICRVYVFLFHRHITFFCLWCSFATFDCIQVDGGKEEFKLRRNTSALWSRACVFVFVCDKQIQYKKTRFFLSLYRKKSRYKLMDRHFRLADGEKFKQNFAFYTQEQDLVHSFVSENYWFGANKNTPYTLHTYTVRSARTHGPRTGEVYRVKMPQNFNFNFEVMRIFFSGDIFPYCSHIVCAAYIICILICEWGTHTHTSGTSDDWLWLLHNTRAWIYAIHMCVSNRTEVFMRISGNDFANLNVSVVEMGENYLEI